MVTVFIAWSGENREIGQKLSVLLSTSGYRPIVGGEAATKMTVTDQIIKQMEEADLAVLIIEKNSSEKENADSLTVSGNIMFEWGYLLHKLNDPTKICACLLNLTSRDLPSDVVGCWACELEKKSYEKEFENERDAEFNRIAEEIFSEFVMQTNKSGHGTDKLYYFDTWEENKHYIIDYMSNERVREQLLFGMQATIYSGNYERLYDKLHDIMNKDEELPEEARLIIKCARAILKVFVETKRLTCPLNEDNYEALTEELSIKYEKKIKNENLAAWCRIFRNDKLELCDEMFARGLSGYEKKWYLEKAIEKCYGVIALLDEQVAKNPADRYYALLYYAFANRNIAVNYEELYKLAPANLEYKDKIEEYCAKTLEIRKELYDYYLEARDKNCISMDYITQEYVLALTEQYRYETDPVAQGKIRRKINSVYKTWEEENCVRNMIFDRITKELNERNFNR